MSISANFRHNSVYTELKKNQQAVRQFHTHDIPLDMEDIERDWNSPVREAGIAAKSSIIVRVGMLALSAGSSGFHVRDMMHSMAYPLHMHVRADVNLTDIEATCTDGKERITEVINLPSTGVNTERIWLLGHFIDWFNMRLGVGTIYHSQGHISNTIINELATTDNAAKLSAQAAKHGTRIHMPSEKPLTVAEVHHHLDLLERRKPLYTPWFSALASAVACACFVFLLGGALFDMLGAFVGAGLGQYVRRKLMGRHINQFVVVFIAVSIAALACTGLLQLAGHTFYPPALLHSTAYIGSMLFVVPGFPMITGGMDLAKVDVQSGVQRIMYVLTIILMATLAGWMVAEIIQLNPQGFEPQGLNPVVLCLLRMACAFGGVWDFSVLFNSPQRMCCIAGLIGLITDTLRLEFVDVGLPMEFGAFLAALLAGLLASAWRSLVRHGKLPSHLGYPRICLSVPSIVIMVPGLYMYRSMYYLGQLNTLGALDWGFKAFMVVVCLPLGLIMARVITDRSWRHDE